MTNERRKEERWQGRKRRRQVLKIYVGALLVTLSALVFTAMGYHLAFLAVPFGMLAIAGVRDKMGKEWF